ncbi:4'-phosphopantetheinyl transferase superfamily protein [Bosea sp. AS-1]|uniref:4'-phosphopantetheinyl transferase family protein n=1 Tax=Bosea sp. AS-1 TaxID=2015316 RepID=UPI000B777853|nr:4'-phosphopantetheinyl transferase superfamily protein [Bosea sp. AS-1]
MHWLRSIAATAPSYPAVWLIETQQRPRNLVERSRLRRETAQAVLAQQLGCPDGEVVISHDPAGQPRLAGPHASALHISLATRAGVVAVALARRPVGVDLELVDPDGPLPREALHADELRTLDAIEAVTRPLAFARLWAAKEAYVKALGTGFARPPESFAVSLLAPDRFRIDGVAAEGMLHTIENGGQEILAAAMIVLDEA